MNSRDYDIVLRYTNRGWIGIVMVNEKERYRTWDFYRNEDDALKDVKLAIQDKRVDLTWA